jgi:hypothetical protein
MIAKLELWGKHLSRGELDSFWSPHDFEVKSWKDFDAGVLQTVKELLESLEGVLCKYFPELYDRFEWIRNPFLVIVETLPNNLSASEEEQLLELASDDFLRTAFQQKTRTSFWLSVRSEYLPNATDGLACRLQDSWGQVQLWKTVSSCHVLHYAYVGISFLLLHILRTLLRRGTSM